MPEIQVTHVSFGTDGLEIGFVEPRDRGEEVIMFRTIVIPAEMVEVELGEVLDTLQDIVDKGQTALRKIPERVPAKPREFRP